VGLVAAAVSCVVGLTCLAAPQSLTRITDNPSRDRAARFHLRLAGALALVAAALLVAADWRRG
jgi:hypothetical protein